MGLFGLSPGERGTGPSFGIVGCWLLFWALGDGLEERSKVAADGGEGMGEEGVPAGGSGGVDGVPGEGEGVAAAVGGEVGPGVGKGAGVAMDEVPELGFDGGGPGAEVGGVMDFRHTRLLGQLAQSASDGVFARFKGAFDELDAGVGVVEDEDVGTAVAGRDNDRTNFELPGRLRNRGCHGRGRAVGRLTRWRDRQESIISTRAI